MKNRLLFLVKKRQYLIDLLFIVLLFYAVLFKFPVFGKYINQQEISFILVLSIWGFYKVFFSKLKPQKILIYDVFFILVLLYSILNFYLFSNTTVYYTRFWIFIGYFLVFYFFRWIFSQSRKNKTILHSTLILVLFSCLLQSVYAIFQKTGYLATNNKYFNIVGSFPSPNYLGLFLGFGLSIFLWYFFVFKIQNKKILVVSIICFLIITTVFIMTESRGSWLGFLGSSFLLFIVSKKNTAFIKKLSVGKKTLFLIVAFTVIFIGTKFLYSLNEESIAGRKFSAKITTQEIIKKPIFGHGLFNFEGKYNRAKSDYFNLKERSWNEIKAGNYVFSPFNDYLLIGFELGLFVLILLFILGIIIFLKAKINNETKVGMAILINLFIWMLFNAALRNVTIMLIGAIGFAILFAYGEFKTRYFIRNIYPKKLKIILSFVSLIGVYAIYSKVSGVKKFDTYYTKHKNNFDPKKLIHLSKPLENNSRYSFDLGRILYLNGHKKASFEMMENNFKKTSLPKLGKILAKYYIKEKNFKRSKEIFQFNIGVEPFRYEPQMNLITLMKNTENYKEVVRLSKIVIDFPVKIPSPKIDRYKEISQRRVRKYSKK